MQTVQASYILHHDEKRIKLQFEDHRQLNKLVKQVPGAKWSKLLKSWHIPCNTTLYNLFKNNLPAGWQLINVKEARKWPETVVFKTLLIKQTESPVIESTSPSKVYPSALNNANGQALQQYLQCLQLKAYSASTIKTYRSEFTAFLQILGSTAAQNLTTQRIKDYLQYCHTTLKITENTIHSRINALKFYYEKVLNRDKFFWEIPRPKKPYILPKVMSEKELSRLFNAAAYLKHKAILFTAYSAGLRVSEIIHLQWKHIDKNRGQILIDQAKGKKDRYVTLSPVLEDILISYYSKCKVKPVKYVFESVLPGEPYSARSAQAIF